MNRTEEKNEALQSRERGLVLILAAGLGILFVALLCLSWLKWGDPVIDTGREMEIPWKISEGGLLYRDMAYNYGPLSPYLNALFLEVLGTRLASLAISGILAAAAGALLVYLACRIFLGRPASLCMAAVFLLECAFQHYFHNGNFNFILPYSFPMVHATLAAFGALILLCRHLDGKGRRPLVLAGLLAGVSFLCKVEMAGAILVPMALLPVLARIKCRESIRELARDTAAWAIPLALVLLLGFLPFIAGASFRKVIWENVFKPQLVDFGSNVFFMQHLGLDALRENLVKIGKSLALWAVFVAAIGFGCSFLGGGRGADRTKPASLSLGMAASIVLGAIITAWFFLPWDIEFRGLPVVALLVVLVSALSIGFARRKHDAIREDAKMLAFSLFAVLALFRILLTAGTFHYGFCLALPGVCLFAVFLLRLAPKWIPPLRRHALFYSGAVLCLLMALSARNFFVDSLDMYTRKTVALEGPGGRMMIHPTLPDATLEQALDHLNEKGSAEDTLLVLPEGAAMNFLSLQRNPTYYNLFIPPELNAPGVEAAVIADIEKHEVDRILLVDRNVFEYGYRGFGVDYGRDLMQYVKEHYTVEAAFGPPPYNQKRQGGCIIYLRNEHQGE